MDSSDHVDTSDRTTSSARFRTAVPLVLAILPPLYLVIIILTQTVDVPFADQWTLVPLLAHSYQGTLSFHDLWTQHNEHRLLFPRLLMIGLARLSGWNTHVEMLANVVLAAGILSILVYQVRITAQTTRTPWAFLVPAISLAVFSLNQAENWWAGWNIQIYLSVLMVSASIVLLTQPVRQWRTLLLALACSIIASYSYSPGVLIWLVGGLLLAGHAGQPRYQQYLRILLWGGIGTLTIGAFFYDYTWTIQTPSLGSLLNHPSRYLTYTITYLGASATRGAVEYLFGMLTGDVHAICNLGASDLCTYVNRAAIVAGISGLLLLTLTTWLLTRKLSLETMLPYLGFSLYAISTGLATSLGRASYGNHQALAQRYATTASLFWIALVILLALAAQVYAAGWFVRTTCVTVSLVVMMLILLSTLKGLDHFQWQQAFLAPARQGLIRLNNDEVLRRLFFDPRVVKEGARTLKKYHLSVYR